MKISKSAKRSVSKLAAVLAAAGLLALAIFLIRDHQIKNDERVFNSLDPAVHELLDRARLIQSEKTLACFIYAGEELETKWLRQFGTKYGDPRLRECEGLYSHLIFWGDLSKTDYTRTHVIVFQKHKGYLLAPARGR